MTERDIEPNDPAFPSDTEWGLTKREYFAALCLQGMADWTVIDSTRKSIAEDAVKYADALIEALNKEQGE